MTKPFNKKPDAATLIFPAAAYSHRVFGPTTPEQRLHSGLGCQAGSSMRVWTNCAFNRHLHTEDGIAMSGRSHMPGCLCERHMYTAKGYLDCTLLWARCCHWLRNTRIRRPMNTTYQEKPSGKAGFEVPCGCDTFACCCAGGLACPCPGLFIAVTHKFAVLTLRDPGITRHIRVPHTRVCPVVQNDSCLVSGVVCLQRYLHVGVLNRQP
jgi:hypothetical protein